MVKVTNFHVQSGLEILGRVSAYFGTVKSQGRGTLHQHLIVWLKDALNSDQMGELLKTARFCDKVTSYITVNLRAYLPGLSDLPAWPESQRPSQAKHYRPG